jgi:hypothetical protein
MSMTFETQPTTSTQPHFGAAAPLSQRKCGCGAAPGLDGACETCRRNQLIEPRAGALRPQHSQAQTAAGVAQGAKGSPSDATVRAAAATPLGHDFSRVRLLAADGAAFAANDQTPVQSGGLAEEYMQESPPAASVKQAAGPEINLGEKTARDSKTPVVDGVELVSTPSGAVGGYPGKEDLCDASLNRPEPFNDTFHRGSVANVHQVQFHLSQGGPTDLRAVRMMNRTSGARGQTFNKSGYDGPPLHEYQFTKDKLVVADAPGWCRTLKESDFPVTYSADFSVYVFDPSDNKVAASISYRVEISKTHYSQRDPVNDVKVTAKMLGGVVPSPSKAGK